jgi:hypothetical protein
MANPVPNVPPHLLGPNVGGGVTDHGSQPVHRGCCGGGPKCY